MTFPMLCLRFSSGRFLLFWYTNNLHFYSFSIKSQNQKYNLKKKNTKEISVSIKHYLFKVFKAFRKQLEHLQLSIIKEISNIKGATKSSVFHQHQELQKKTNFGLKCGCNLISEKLKSTCMLQNTTKIGQR